MSPHFANGAHCPLANRPLLPRYSLVTLVALTALAPPAIAFLWFAWRLVLFLGLFLAAVALWVAVSLAIARFCAGVICSVMR